MSWSSVERTHQVLLVSASYNGFHVTGMKASSQKGYWERREPGNEVGEE